MTDHDLRSPDGLRAAIDELHGSRGLRKTARALFEAGILSDDDGSSLRKMSSGARPIRPEVAAALGEMLAEIRNRRSEQTGDERVIFRILDAAPHAPLLCAAIFLRLRREGATAAALNLEFGKYALESEIGAAVDSMRRIGVVNIDGGIPPKIRLA